MGLGLAVSYGIICRHDGSVEVESELGRGTSFVIKLAVARVLAPVQAIEINVEPISPAVPVRILVVDDEDHVRHLLRDILGSLGHQAVEAEDGFKALELFESQAFDAVFTDLGMPGMNGWELARLIREINSEVPLAILSGWGEAISSDEQEAAKINWIVAKPFLLERIVEIVDEISERHLQAARTSPCPLSLVA
jgi:CheY-like chemotaxis protein